MFLFKGKEANARSFVKAVSWRTLGSIDTFVLGLVFTHGNMGVAGKIAGTEVVTKILLYFFHERVWAQIRWGFRPSPPQTLPAATPVAPDATPNAHR